MIPAPDERLRARLAHLPDACRDLLAALDRQAARGGGEVMLRLDVTPSGEVWRLELPHVYVRRAVESGGGAT